MKKLILIVIVLLPLFSSAQSSTDRIKGIGNYIIGGFTVKKLYHVINEEGLKVYSDPRDTNSKVDHIYRDKSEEIKVYVDEIDTNSKVERIEISDATIFSPPENDLEEKQKIELFFYHDTLFSIDLPSPSEEFKVAFFKKYGKGKLKESHSYTICKPSWNHKSNEKMKNFDSSNTWYNSNIVTKYVKIAHYARNDNGDCFQDDAVDNFSITDIVIKDETDLDAEKKIKKDNKEKYDNQVNKIYKKI